MSYAENQITLEVVEDGNEVYVTEPTTPYSAGDLYVDKDETTTAMVTDDDDPLVDDSDNQFEVVEVGESDIYVCTNPRGSGEFNNDDWRLAASTQDKKLREHFWHDDQGAHVLGELSGFRNDITSTGMKIMDTSTETSVAEFGGNGARIGKSGAAHSEIDANGQRFYDVNGNSLANIGYGEGNSTQGGVELAPYYTFGYRYYASTADIGNYSVAEGFSTIAKSFASHAEGMYTAADGEGAHAEGIGDTDQSVAHGRASHVEGRNSAAMGDYSHVEGEYSTARGEAAHCEGNHTTASGDYSHAEGISTTASGDCSHSGGYATTAQRKSQTVIGEYNVLDTSGLGTAYRGKYAFIIGNGTANNARSNALTVDWSGNVVLAGGLTVASPTTSFTGTVGSGLSGSCNGIYDTLSKTVRINFQVRKSTDISISDVLFTIPSAYRPSAAVSGSGVVEAYVSSTYRTRAYEVTLDTSGQIKQGYSNYARSVFGVLEYSL